jgi:hypothetical protein
MSPQYSCAQPKLEIVGGSTFDWGVIRTFDTLSATLTIKNTGTEELVVSEIKPECGCTTAPLSKDRIPAGDSALLSIKFDPGQYNIGETRKMITLMSNSAGNPKEVLVVKATFIRPLQPSAFSVQMPAMVVGKPSTATVKLRNTIDKPVMVTSIGGTNGIATGIRSAFSVKPGEEFDLKVTVTPDKTQLGYYYAQLQVKTDHPDEPAFVLNFYGNVSEAPSETILPATTPAGKQGKQRKSKNSSKEKEDRNQ